MDYSSSTSVPYVQNGVEKMISTIFLNTLWRNVLWNFQYQLQVQIKVDETAMIMNQYNRIPHPSQDTIRERNTNNQDGIK